MHNFDEKIRIIQAIRVKISQEIKDLNDSGIKNTESRSFIYSMKIFLEKLDSFEQELLYVPLSKYVDIKNRFPGSPRN